MHQAFENPIRYQAEMYFDYLFFFFFSSWLTIKTLLTSCAIHYIPWWKEDNYLILKCQTCSLITWYSQISGVDSAVLTGTITEETMMFEPNQPGNVSSQPHTLFKQLSPDEERTANYIASTSMNLFFQKQWLLQCPGCLGVWQQPWQFAILIRNADG